MAERKRIRRRRGVPKEDEGALITRLYRELERPVLGYFMRATGQPELAADLAAETFARVLEGLAGFDPDRGSHEQWVFGIARNVLGSCYRERRVDASARRRLGLPTLVLEDHALEAIARLDAREVGVTLALAALPADQREAIDLRVLGDREYADIASELCCSEAVIRQRVSRGLRTLRARMAGER